MASEIFCSYIIPTIGRNSLEAAVRSVLDQNLPADFEVVVVNDSGSPLPLAGWQASQLVKVIDTDRCERSYARNAGAAVARGKYLAFLDDDDWILPGALEVFLRLANHCPEAAWLYGGIRIVDGQHRVLAEINSGFRGCCFSQIMGGAWAPLQSSLIQSRAFFEVGGFSPFICGTEDEDLCRRIAHFYEFANTSEVVACLFRGQTWTTSTNYLRAPADTKYSRDLLLARPGSFRRLFFSARSSYWHGRNLRVCLSTILYNLRKKRLFTTLNRAAASLALAASSARHLFARDYWAGLRAHHVPNTLHFVMEEYESRERG